MASKRKATAGRTPTAPIRSPDRGVRETAQIGKGKAGPGRPKGLPNKATANAREAIARFVDGNVERLQGWLDEIASEEGARSAWSCFMDVIEYHVPKLARLEHTGEDGGAVQLHSSIEYVDAPQKPGAVPP